MLAKANVGKRIRKIRRDNNMSIEELANSSGVKDDLIKKIEDGEMIPSLAPLIKISRALGVRLGTLLDDTIQEGPVVIKRGKTEKVIHFQGEEGKINLEFYPLGAGKIDRHMEPFIINVKPYNDDFKLSSHEGEEFIYVLDGEIEILYGKDKYHLREGDSIYYDSIIPHHVHAMGDENAKILAVVYTPI